MKEIPIRAVITGSSSGIGREIAIQLAQQSSGDDQSHLVIHYRRNRSGAEQTARLVQAIGCRVDVVQADLCDPDQRSRLVDFAWDFLGVPTTWVNNAGADVLTGDARKLSFTEKLDRLIATDVLATIDLSRQVIERMMDGIGPDASHANDSQPNLFPPSMTFIGWDQAPFGMEGDAGQMFGPVKAAVMAFANSLAQEVAPAIRVNTVAPGWIKTAWGESTDSYWDNRAKAESLMDRWGSPADVARAVCFVADPANTFCSGQTIHVNGGWNRTRRS
ncbi:MAG: SDR family oxidoreductase [Planctomycetales bacterium]|nr:SDR family oxidoreductase [Planctomycetales bacterium]